MSERAKPRFAPVPWGESAVRPVPHRPVPHCLESHGIARCVIIAALARG